MDNDSEITVLQEIKVVRLEEEKDGEPIPPGVDVMDLTREEMPSFTIDTSGSEARLNNTLFETDVVGVLEHDNGAEEKESVVEESSTGSQCFNCRGPHQLSQCPEPRNQATINKNRLEYIANSIPKARYHGDEAQKFDHIKPGRISRRLRDALNLRSKDLPNFIYKMRVYGYPPGWLEEAKLEGSGINIDDDVADGEISGSKGSTPSVQLDFSKIVEYPGFNVEAPDYYDRATRERHIPPMQSCHMKQYMIYRLMQDSHYQTEASGTRKDNPSSTGNDETSITNSEDPSNSDEVVYVETIQSSSLEELERQKQLLLSQLEMVHDDSTTDLTTEDSSAASPIENVVDLVSPSEVDTQSQDSNLPEVLNGTCLSQDPSQSDSVISQNEPSSSVVELGATSKENDAPVYVSDTLVEQEDAVSNVLELSPQNSDIPAKIPGSLTKKADSVFSTSAPQTPLEDKSRPGSNDVLTTLDLQDSISLQADELTPLQTVDKLNCSPKFSDSSPRLGSSRKVDHGTPISVRFSPYSRLPKFENFSSGVGQIEMSPPVASSGAYNKVKSLLAERRKGLGLTFMISPRGK